jgi:hypothetical protein
MVRTHGRSLAPFAGGWRSEYILHFGQTPNGKPNNLDHTESQFVLQTGDDVEIRLCEPNGCRSELVIPHGSFFLQDYKVRVVAEEQGSKTGRDS